MKHIATTYGVSCDSILNTSRYKCTVPFVSTLFFGTYLTFIQCSSFTVAVISQKIIMIQTAPHSVQVHVSNNY